MSACGLGICLESAVHIEMGVGTGLNCLLSATSGPAKFRVWKPPDSLLLTDTMTSVGLSPGRGLECSVGCCTESGVRLAFGKTYQSGTGQSTPRLAGPVGLTFTQKAEAQRQQLN